LQKCSGRTVLPKAAWEKTLNKNKTCLATIKTLRDFYAENTKNENMFTVVLVPQMKTHFPLHKGKALFSSVSQGDITGGNKYEVICSRDHNNVIFTTALTSPVKRWKKS